MQCYVWLRWLLIFKQRDLSIGNCTTSHSGCETVWNTHVWLLYHDLFRGTLTDVRLQTFCRFDIYTDIYILSCISSHDVKLVAINDISNIIIHVWVYRQSSSYTDDNQLTILISSYRFHFFTHRSVFKVNITLNGRCVCGRFVTHIYNFLVNEYIMTFLIKKTQQCKCRCVEYIVKWHIMHGFYMWVKIAWKYSCTWSPVIDCIFLWADNLPLNMQMNLQLSVASTV